MKELKRLEPLQAATQFILKHYPNCQGALLAGSVVRGEATRTSDLDLVILMIILLLLLGSPSLNLDGQLKFLLII